MLRHQAVKKANVLIFGCPFQTRPKVVKPASGKNLFFFVITCCLLLVVRILVSKLYLYPTDQAFFIILHSSFDS